MTRDTSSLTWSHGEFPLIWSYHHCCSLWRSIPWCDLPLLTSTCSVLPHCAPFGQVCGLRTCCGWTVTGASPLQKTPIRVYTLVSGQLTIPSRAYFHCLTRCYHQERSVLQLHQFNLLKGTNDSLITQSCATLPVGWSYGCLHTLLRTWSPCWTFPQDQWRWAIFLPNHVLPTRWHSYVSSALDCLYWCTH